LKEVEKYIMKKSKAIITISLVCLLILTPIALLVGCGGEDEATSTPSGTSTPFVLKGTIDEAGSTSVQPLAEMLAHEFEKLHSGVTVNISGGGSSAGVKSCASGVVDIGAASRDIKITETDLIPYAISRDAVAIAVHSSNPISELTVDQVASIYKGDITNWSEVGGGNAEIVVVSREEGSGTRDTFESKVTKNIKEDALFYDSNGGVKAKVAATPNSIGYLSLGYVEGIKALVLDGVECTVENCVSGEYPVLRRLYLLTTETPTGAIKAFLDFCRSEDGQKIVEEQGYIPLNI
jgi:phosphate transport system substrate-binding protein